jgi:hypothetical protein
MWAFPQGSPWAGVQDDHSDLLRQNTVIQRVAIASFTVKVWNRPSFTVRSIEYFRNDALDARGFLRLGTPTNKAERVVGLTHRRNQNFA